MYQRDVDCDHPGTPPATLARPSTGGTAMLERLERQKKLTANQWRIILTTNLGDSGRTLSCRNPRGATAQPALLGQKYLLFMLGRQAIRSRTPLL